MTKRQMRLLREFQRRGPEGFTVIRSPEVNWPWRTMPEELIIKMEDDYPEFYDEEDDDD